MSGTVIMGAGGRDFHVFNTVFRADPTRRVVAFTAAQIPGIADRRYPPALSGPRYPDGIPIVAEEELERVVRDAEVDEVIFAYSDLVYDEVMHRAARVLAAGADFRLVGPRATMLRSRRPVVAVCATRTGAGKSQTSRRIARLVRDAGLRVALVRHPMPYGDLEAMRVQRFTTLDEIDAAHPTIEEREEYEEPVRMGIPVYAGVDYEAILRLAEDDADVVLWDGGNNDFPFFAPDLLVTVADALRPGHELRYHPGEVNVRMADVVVVNKVDAAPAEWVAEVVANVGRLNPDAAIVRAASPVALDPGPSLAGVRVVVVEDGPTITHGGMAFGAGAVAARAAGAEIVDPRPTAVGSIADTYRRYPHIGSVLPAMGYGEQQIRDLVATIESTACAAVVSGTPFDLARLLDLSVPVRRARYHLVELDHPDLAELLTPRIRDWLDGVGSSVRGRPPTDVER